jgi:hypothetical protein
VVNFTLRPLYPQGKNPWYPLNRRLGGTQSRSGHGGVEENSQPLPRLKPPIFQPVVQRHTTEIIIIIIIIIIILLLLLLLLYNESFFVNINVKTLQHVELMVKSRIL